MALGTLGKYERLDVLGHGVSGIVYLAKDTLLNKQVALKEVDVQAGDLRRFLEEARVMDRLRHPNIVRVNGVDRIDGKVVIDMEYVRGQNLQEMLRMEGRLPLDRALEVAIQTLDALDYAHRMQTVHRDIKPANILIARDGTVKLVDFGLAEILATNAYAGGAGTYAYMAPEDFAEEDRSDSQSDIWAVGVTLYEMLTENRPFQVVKVKDPFAWKRVLDTETPTALSAHLPNAPSALQAILDRALARDKRRRYQTAGEFRDDLTRLRAGESPSAATLAVGAETATRRSRAPLAKNRDAAAPDDTRTIQTPRAGPGVVVAEVGEAASVPVREGQRENPKSPIQNPKFGEAAPPKQPVRRSLIGRKAVVAKLTVEPEEIDFGSVRKGEARSVKLQARVQGVEGAVHGRVLTRASWLSVHPSAFDRTRQTITLTAHSERAWETGEFQETVRIETEAGETQIPVRLFVLKPRPTFLQIAAWYVPLFGAALFPVLAVALGGHGFTAGSALLVPSAAAATALLSLMLLLIGVAVDIGIAERVACGFITAVMCFVLGAAAARGQSGLYAQGMHDALVTGGVVGGVLVLQLLYLSRWKFWALLLFCLGLVFGGTFLHVVSSGRYL